MDADKLRSLLEKLSRIEYLLSDIQIKEGHFTLPRLESRQVHVLVSIGKDEYFEKRKKSYRQEPTIIFVELKDGPYFSQLILGKIVNDLGLLAPKLVEQKGKTFLYRFE